jgi:hypothetical protein
VRCLTGPYWRLIPFFTSCSVYFFSLAKIGGTDTGGRQIHSPLPPALGFLSITLLIFLEKGLEFLRSEEWLGIDAVHHFNDGETRRGDLIDVYRGAYCRSRLETKGAGKEALPNNFREFSFLVFSPSQDQSGRSSWFG